MAEHWELVDEEAQVVVVRQPSCLLKRDYEVEILHVDWELCFCDSNPKGSQPEGRSRPGVRTHLFGLRQTPIRLLGRNQAGPGNMRR